MLTENRVQPTPLEVLRDVGNVHKPIEDEESYLSIEKEMLKAHIEEKEKLIDYTKERIKKDAEAERKNTPDENGTNPVLAENIQTDNNPNPSITSAAEVKLMHAILAHTG
jgi:hypothetical protein